MTEQEWLASEDPGAMLAWWLGPVPEAVNPVEKRSRDRKLRLFAVARARLLQPLSTQEAACRDALLVAERHADDEGDPDVRGRATNAMDDVRCFGNPCAACLARYAVRSSFLPNTLQVHGETPNPAGQAALLREIAGNPFRPLVRHDDYVCPDHPHHRKTYFSATGRGPFCPECPGCPPMVRPWKTWLTPTVLSLARAAYEERQDNGTLDPVRLAVLADALEEAGCPAEEVGEVEFPAVLSCPDCGDGGFWRAGQEFDHMRKCRRRECGTVWVPGELVRRKVKTPHPLLAHLRSPGPHVRGCWALDLVLGKE